MATTLVSPERFKMDTAIRRMDAALAELDAYLPYRPLNGSGLNSADDGSDAYGFNLMLGRIDRLEGFAKRAVAAGVVAASKTTAAPSQYGIARGAGQWPDNQVNPGAMSQEEYYRRFSAAENSQRDAGQPIR